MDNSEPVKAAPWFTSTVWAVTGMRVMHHASCVTVQRLDTDLSDEGKVIILSVTGTKENILETRARPPHPATARCWFFPNAATCLNIIRSTRVRFCA
jgi:hypothetical protein